jgi:hypothetical protein
MAEGLRTDFGSGYPDAPQGVGLRKWLKACDRVSMDAWARGVEPDWGAAVEIVKREAGASGETPASVT